MLRRPMRSAVAGVRPSGCRDRAEPSGLSAGRRGDRSAIGADGVGAGVLWVIIRTWLPDAGIRRALVATVVSIAFGSFLLIRGANSDFVILGFNPVVVGTLIALVGAVGFFISIVDGWLDRRLPVATSVRSRAASVYAAISLVGALLILPLVVLTFLGLSGDEAEVRRAPLRPVGIGLLVVGVATVRWWFLRLHGADRPPRSLLLFGRASLAEHRADARGCSHGRGAARRRAGEGAQVTWTTHASVLRP